MTGLDKLAENVTAYMSCSAELIAVAKAAKETCWCSTVETVVECEICVALAALEKKLEAL